MKDFLKKYNILAAPMEGVMRPALIEVCNALELTQVWVTPFFRVSESVPKERDLKKFLAPFAPEKNRVILQIMGVDPAKLAETARRGMACGAAGIDLNCGCPSHQVIRHGAGAGALKQIENTAAIIEAVSTALPESFFSIKTRLGFYTPDEAPAAFKLWSNAGKVDMFTLHYRTAQEGYKNVPGRETRLTAARQLLPDTALVFGNGNVQSIAEARQLARSCRLDGVMIGRAFWRDPGMLRRHFDPHADRSISDPQAARELLWQHLQALEFRKNHWSLGNAIELAGMIFGADSVQFQELKNRFKLRA